MPAGLDAANLYLIILVAMIRFLLDKLSIVIIYALILRFRCCRSMEYGADMLIIIPYTMKVVADLKNKARIFFRALSPYRLVYYIQPPQPTTKSTKIKKIRNGLLKNPPKAPSNNPLGSDIIYYPPLILLGLRGSFNSVYEIKSTGHHAKEMILFKYDIGYMVNSDIQPRGLIGTIFVMKLKILD
jgi:hypothetical protein